MKKTKILALAVMAFFTGAAAFAQRGYYDAPYTRYEAEAGTVSGGALKTAARKTAVDKIGLLDEQVIVHAKMQNRCKINFMEENHPAAR